MKNRQYRVKVKLPDSTTIERNAEHTKRLKDNADYIDVGWKVLGVPYWGHVEKRDRDGEAFHPETDIWLKTGDEVNITYYHGFGADSPDEWQEIPVIIGRAKYVGNDARGHWFEPMLDADEPLAQRLMSAGMDNVKASSGAVSHLVRMGNGGLIDVWPVGELALFDVNEWRLPANDYAVVEAKSADIPESIAEDGDIESIEVNVSDEAIEVIEIKSNKHEELIMNEQEEKVETPQVDVKAELDAFKKSFLAELKEELKAEKGEPKGDATIKAPAVIDHRGQPDYRKSFWHYVRTGETSELRKAKAALNEGTTTEGGFLVPDDEYGSIIAKRDENSILSRLGVRRVTTDRDKFNFPTENASLSKFSLVAEEGPISAAEDEPTFAQNDVVVYNFKKLIKVSEELMEDENSGLEMFLNDAIGRALADTENYYALIGAGTTEPQGITVGGTAGLTLDSATAIGAAEIPELMGKLGTPYHSGAAFFMDPATWFYLKGLTGSQFIFTDGVARLSGTVDGPTLEGFPVVLNSNMANIAASAKSVAFGNMNYLGVVQNRGLRIRRLNELYAGNGQIGILANIRFGCEVLQAEAIQYATHPTA